MDTEEVNAWAARNFAPPSPTLIKKLVLLRNAVPGKPWVETGTYLGDTTHLLSQCASHVYSIEPEPELFKNAANRFEGFPNVTLINGRSETVFPELLPTLNGDLNFWLDGHYSAGFTYKGPKDTPVLDELDCIQRNLKSFSRVAVMIDDIRLFNPLVDQAYPELDYLVDWARRNNLQWHIEQDIFVAKTRTSL